ncbi:MAG: NUDIX hydrolase [Spirochaetota bacterium]
MDNLNIRIRVAAVIIENSEILLIAHRKEDSVYWMLPGGGVNPGESLEEALIREIKEELNIIVKVNDIALVYDSISPDLKKHIENICFFCAHSTGTYVLSNENRLHDFGFFNIQKLKNLQIVPPVKTELENILLGLNNTIYKGKKWLS